MKEFWEARYAEEHYAYGKEANAYLKQVLPSLKPGRILFPGEGEGRNAVYAASLGWESFAFDQSNEGRRKAIALAEQRALAVTYDVCTFSEMNYKSNSFDAIALIFVHLSPQDRAIYHRKLIEYLKPGGYLILEAFSKKHLEFNTRNPQAGGPKSLEMLYSEEELRSDFEPLNIVELQSLETHLAEGVYHSGQSAVLRLKAQKSPV